MCVLSSWEKTKFVPKNGKSGQTEKAGQQKIDEVSDLMNIFKLQMKYFILVKTSFFGGT